MAWVDMRMTKYERAALIGDRAAEITWENALVDVSDLLDPVSMAARELYAGKCPLYVSRPHPDGSVQTIAASALTVPPSANLTNRGPNLRFA